MDVRMLVAESSGDGRSRDKGGDADGKARLGVENKIGGRMDKNNGGRNGKSGKQLHGNDGIRFEINLYPNRVHKDQPRSED
ncbi:unnamed protein product [Dovyalis caffra]|uniref:Uncharacterized protein n=1 Tax=Dovyalis caffra TaxID=77055 RepID=A0AAV1QZM2_9ROSI|nr:unnamed protein product [Dovyalis caffra]